jgi:hypothetical protein
MTGAAALRAVPNDAPIQSALVAERLNSSCFCGVREPRKADVRLYTYGGRVLLTSARLCQSQTTNFRTPGGGFAPVFFI